MMLRHQNKWEWTKPDRFCPPSSPRKPQHVKNIWSTFIRGVGNHTIYWGIQWIAAHSIYNFFNGIACPSCISFDRLSSQSFSHSIAKAIHLLLGLLCTLSVYFPVQRWNVLYFFLQCLRQWELVTISLQYRPCPPSDDEKLFNWRQVQWTYHFSLFIVSDVAPVAKS